MFLKSGSSFLFVLSGEDFNSDKILSISSSEKNNVLLNHNEKLKSKEEEIVKLNIKINSLEENIQSLNDIIEATKREKNTNTGVTENMTKLLEQISEKDKKILSDSQKKY